MALLLTAQQSKVLYLILLTLITLLFLIAHALLIVLISMDAITLLFTAVLKAKSITDAIALNKSLIAPADQELLLSSVLLKVQLLDAIKIYMTDT